MKTTKFIFSLLSLIFLLAFPAYPVKPQTANPINIASRLIMQSDSAKVASTLEYYGYSIQPSDNEYIVFKHPDGTIIRFTYPPADYKQNYHTVVVVSKVDKKEAEKRLKELDYKKVENGYESNSSKYSTHITKCSFGSGKTITFQRQKKNN